MSSEHSFVLAVMQCQDVDEEAQFSAVSSSHVRVACPKSTCTFVLTGTRALRLMPASAA